MSKDEYNIDSILSEIKHKREEEKAKTAGADVKADEKADVEAESVAEAEPTAEEGPDGSKDEKPVVAESTVDSQADTADEKAESEAEAESVTEEGLNGSKAEKPATEESLDGSKDEKADVEAESEATAEPAAEEGLNGSKDEKADVEAESEAEAEPPAEEGLNGSNGEKMVDLMEMAEEEGEAEEAAPPEEPAPEAPAKKPKSKTQKILTAVILALVVLIVAAGAVFAIKANDWLKILENNNQGETAVTQAEWQGMKKLVEKFDPIEETEATELSSLEDMVRTWYYNGAPCASTHVINVLLIGEDTRGDEILEDETRADAAIIASINTDTKEIVLTSILRDSWAYWETVPGDESTGHFGKLNGAMSTGNLNVYINSVERLYKIDIDNYAIVNFTSFETIIDTLYKDGIELELTDAEIREINNHQGRYGHVTIEKTFEGEQGKIRLNGEQALAYCRIRHIDTDNARADRQKTTLMKIYEDFRNASAAKQMKLVDKLVPYVKTGFSSNEIIKMATYGLSHGWMGYDIHSFNYPAVNVTGGIYGSDFLRQWVWRADFPADAYDMQMRIYGKSSITLAKVRVDTKRVNQTGFYQDGARATSYTYTNTAYGETTTIVPYEEEEEETSEGNE